MCRPPATMIEGHRLPPVLTPVEALLFCVVTRQRPQGRDTSLLNNQWKALAR